MSDANKKKRRWYEETDEDRAQYRATFVPHAIIETERSRPSQITICGMVGGVRRFRYVFFDASAPEGTWPRVALEAMWALIHSFYTGRPAATAVPFFGEPTGLTVNYTPDLAVTYDLELNETQRHAAARQLCPIRLRPRGLAGLAR